ncbi:DNA damage-responsive transcriptional repressor Rph1p [Monosporozyma servazzii]
MSFQPVETINGVPIFKPSFHDFKSFDSYINNIKKFGFVSGVIKVIPPKEWVERLTKNEHYLDVDLLKDIKIKTPIQQNITGNKGLYMIQNIEKKKNYNIIQWKNLTNNYKLPNNPRNNIIDNDIEMINDSDFNHFAQNLNHDNLNQFNNQERIDFLESYYWKTLNFTMPIYGADTPGSLFPVQFNEWNLDHLPNILNYIDRDIPGVNHSYLYAGAWKSTFAWHLEDQDLYSINYIHFGAPKQWYSIPQDQLSKFESFVKDQFPSEFRSCHEFLRHKTILISPQLLKENGIQCNKIIQHEHEFMITFPHGYHAGFNYGYNLAEAINFADEEWLSKYAPVTKSCQCEKDSVEIDINKLTNNYKERDPQYKTVSSQSSATIEKFPSQAGNVSLRSTSPGPIDPSMNQSSISRVSSPFLARMMDLSNIIEPTLENPALKFNSKKKLSSEQAPQTIKQPQPTTQLHHPQSMKQPRPLLLSQHNSSIQDHNRVLSPVPLSPSILKDSIINQNSSTTHQQSNPIINPTPLNPNRPTSALPFTFDDNDDNLLAMSLTSMANSGKSSPKMLRHLLTYPADFNNSPLNSVFSNKNAEITANGVPNTITPDTNKQVPLRPLFTPGTSNNLFRPLSPFNNLLSNPNPNNILNTSINNLNNNNVNNNNSNNLNNNSTSNTSTGSANNANNINSNGVKTPFLKRTKSSNIVTLNISREGSRSPGPIPMPNSNLTNTLNRIGSPLPMSMSPLYSNMLKSETSDITDESIGLKFDTSKEKAEREPSTKRQKKNNGTTQDIKSNKTNSKGSLVIPPPGKFSSDEVVVSEFGKVYICQECKRQFSSGHHLTRHKKSVHSGEKPYSCPKCGKRFKRRDHVLQHLNKKIPCVPTEKDENSTTTTNVKSSSSRGEKSVTISPPTEDSGKPISNAADRSDIIRSEDGKNGISSPPMTN